MADQAYQFFIRAQLDGLDPTADAAVSGAVQSFLEDPRHDPAAGPAVRRDGERVRIDGLVTVEEQPIEEVLVELARVIAAPNGGSPTRGVFGAWLHHDDFYDEGEPDVELRWEPEPDSEAGRAYHEAIRSLVPSVEVVDFDSDLEFDREFLLVVSSDWIAADDVAAAVPWVHRLEDGVSSYSATGVVSLPAGVLFHDAAARWIEDAKAQMGDDWPARGSFAGYNLARSKATIVFTAANWPKGSARS